MTLTKPFRFGVEELEARDVPSVAFVTAETIPVHSQLTAPVTLTSSATGQISSQQALSANIRYVTHLYEDVLGRSPDPGGLSQWTTALDNGTLTRGQVAVRFVTSTEYRVDVIRAYFQLQLGRPPAPSEVNAYLSRLVAGESQDSLRVTFFASDEFYNRYGRDAGTFVSQLYAQILGRGASAAEIANGLNYLNKTGGDRAGLAAAFLTSPEYYRVQVQAEYGNLLRRSADPAGLNYWVNRRASGVTVEAMTASFLASDEYYLRP